MRHVLSLNDKDVNSHEKISWIRIVRLECNFVNNRTLNSLIYYLFEVSKQTDVAALIMQLLHEAPLS